MKLIDGEIIELDDNKEYIVLKQINHNNINYVYLMTNSKPIEVMFAKQMDDELELIIDDKELKEVMDLFIN